MWCKQKQTTYGMIALDLSVIDDKFKVTNFEVGDFLVHVKDGEQYLFRVTGHEVDRNGNKLLYALGNAYLKMSDESLVESKDLTPLEECRRPSLAIQLRLMENNNRSEVWRKFMTLQWEWSENILKSSKYVSFHTDCMLTVWEQIGHPDGVCMTIPFWNGKSIIVDSLGLIVGRQTLPNLVYVGRKATQDEENLLNNFFKK